MHKYLHTYTRTSLYGCMHVEKNLNLHGDAQTDNKVKVYIYTALRVSEIAFPGDNAKFIGY